LWLDLEEVVLPEIRFFWSVSEILLSDADLELASPWLIESAIVLRVFVFVSYKFQ